METNPTTTIKLLLTGAFIALTTSVFGQSIKIEQYETSSGQTFLVEYGSFFSLANSARVCQQDSVKLTAVGFSGTVTWTLPDNTTISGSSIWVRQSGAYTVTDATNTASTSLSQSTFAPEIYSNEYPVSEIGSEFDVDDTTASTPGGFIPLFQSNNRQQWLTPESRQSAYSKMQFMITADELTEFGFEEGTTLNEIGFNYTDDYYECSSSGHNFQIRVYEVLDTTLSAFESNNSNYLGSFSCGSRSQGWNYFGIGSYEWNGTSTLVFEFDGYTYSGITSPNPEIQIKQTPSDRSVVSVYAQSITSSTPSYSIDYRPLVSFKYKRPARQDSIIICDGSTDLYVTESASSYLWSSASNSQISTDNYLNNHNSGGILYLTTAQSGSLCKYVDTVDIVFNTLVTPTITASSIDFCEGETVTLTASSTATVDFVWNNGVKGSTTTISDGGDYTVTSTDQFGCSKTSLGQEIIKIDKPVLLKSAAAQAPYLEDTHDLLAGDGTTRKISSLEHLFDFGNKKYFVSKYKNDSTYYVDVVSSNPLAEIGVIQSDAINDVFMAAHQEKYNQNSSLYPYRIFTGARWDYVNSTPVWLDGSTSNYLDYSNPSNNNYYFYHNAPSSSWSWRSNFTTSTSYGALIAYDNSDLYIQNGDIVCDSIELFAPSSFSSYLWSTGDTTESIWVSGTGSHSISLTGTYVKSDGSSCSLTSDTYTFTINPSPSLSITNNSGTVDLDGTNFIDLEADYTTGASVLWSTGNTGDTVNIYSIGEYSVTATLNGCSTTESIEVYRPLYVAKTGDDTNGDGSFSNPYLTIQKGIDKASEGQKIYVLPGTYEEGELDFETSSNSGVYKSVYIASDFIRLNNSSAIASTVIDADGEDKIFNIQGSNTSIIEGFTLTGMVTANWESSVIYLRSGAAPTFKNLVIKGNTEVNDAYGPIINIRSASPSFEDVLIEGHGSQNNTWRSMAYISDNSSDVTFKNVTWKDNYAWDYGIIGVWSGAKATLINNLFIDNYHDHWRGILNIHNSSSMTLINTTVANNIATSEAQMVSFWDASNNTQLTLINSVLGNVTNPSFQIYNNGGNNAYVTARNSILPLGTSGSNQASKITWDLDSTNVFTNPHLNSDGTLKDNSPAIGIGTKQPVTIGSMTYTPPTTDLAGVTRPDPAGSSPDAGAYESDKAQGDFDILLSQCGYLLDATVLNSNAYSVAWMFNGDTVSTSGSFTASALGTYTAYVESTDRSSTLSETISLSDPLRFVMMGTKNNCTDVGSSNGYIRWGQPEGGTTNNNNNYYSWVQNSSGSYQWGGTNTEINRKADNNGYHETNSLGAGMYYVSVSDATGCTITDTIEIIDQDQDTYFVSTTGSDSNNGTSTNDAWGSIEYAISQVCDEDTIIVLDGTYYEDSLEVTRDLVLGSMYLIDGDTNHIANTVIDGEDDGWIMRWQAGNGNWSDTTSNQLVGLTIQNGRSTNSDYAGGLSIDNSRVLKVHHVRITDNENYQNHGGGLYSKSGSYVLLQDVTIDNNIALNSAGLYSNYSHNRFINLDVSGNASTGEYGAMYIDGAYEFYSDNVSVTGNSSSSHRTIWLNINNPSSDPIVRNWQVLNNTARSKTFSITQAQSSKKLFIENCLIAGNTVERGGPGLRIEGFRNEVIITNSTITGNTSLTESTKESAAMLVFRSPQDNPTVAVMNSIIENSTSTYTIADRDYNDGVDLTIENSFITGGSSKIKIGSTNSTLTYGTSNLSSGLYFTDAANGDYSLSSVSTLLGAGVSSATVGGISITAPTTDLFGNPRPNPAGTNPDMGAIEGVDSTAQIGIATVVTNNGFCQTASGAITANLLNYTGTATYSWSSSTYPTWTWNSTQSATSLASGDYKVVALDATDGSKIDSMEVTVVTLPSISIANTSTDVTCFGDDDGELTFEISGGNPLGGSQYDYSVDYLQSLAQADGVVLPNNGNWFDNDTYGSSRSGNYVANNYNGNPIYQGKYYVSVSDQDGCTFTDTVVVGYDHELPQVNITTLASDGTVGLTSMCEGTGNTINLTANVTGGGGTNTFSWSNASTAQTVGVAQTGDYYVEVTDQYTCVGKDTIDIYFQSAPQLVVEGAGTPLYNGTALPSGVGNYNWGNNSQYLGNYNGSAYYIIQNSYQSADGIAIAKALGGKLATPRTKAESDWLADKWSSYGCCNAMIGARYDGSTWVDFDGNELTWSNWWGNSVNGVGNPQHGNPATDNYDMATLNTNKEWYNYQTTDHWWLLLEFPAQDAPVTFNQAFCDSIELKATPFVSIDGNGFTEIYWTDAQNDTIHELEYKTFYADQDITLHGVFTRSDGETCDLSSITYSFDVFSSPNLVITNYSGTADLLGGDTIVLVATTDAGTVSWADSAGTVTNNDTLLVTSPGIYTAKANTTTCSSEEIVAIYQPLYVAKTGDDTNGDGSFSSPFLTIQKGIDEASEGQKIYVLPGTYAEGKLDFETSSNSGIYKSVYLASNLVRTDDSTAISTTVIDADGEEYLIDIRGSNSSTIQGFTLTGQQAGSDWQCAVLRLNNGASLTFRDLVIRDNASSSYQQEAQVMNVRNQGTYVTFDNVHFKNNATQNNQSRKTAFIYDRASVNFIDCKWEDNYSWESIVRVQEYASAYFENNLFIDNLGGDWGIVDFDGNYSTATFMNSTIVNNLTTNNNRGLIGISGGNHTVNFINSVLGTPGSGQVMIKNNTSTTNTFIARNSVLSKGIVDGATYSNKLVWDVDATNMIADPQLDTDGTLLATSPAIGLATKNPVTIGSTTFTPPLIDLAGVSRPDPVGSNPDAGAYESDKAQGDFDIQLSQCSYLLEATILNSNSYTLVWLYNGDTVSTSESFEATLLGTYTAYAISTDRIDTVSKTISLSDPLRFDLTVVKNCSVLSSNNGTIYWSNVTGGVRNTADWWEYRSGIKSTSGTLLDGVWTIDENSSHSHSKSPGTYYLYVEDNSGCIVGDTLEILDQGQDTYYVSTTGSDMNSGLSESDAFATIGRAVDYSCLRDTIIILDGTYSEDSIFIDKPIVLGSKYLLDGDTSHIHNTIISGGQNATLYINYVNSTSADTNTSQIVGFTIQNSNNPNTDQWYGHGGAISVWNSVVKIDHMRIKNNYARNGGGLGFMGHGFTAVVSNSVIEGNSAVDGGGIKAELTGDLWIRNTKIKNNDATGSGGGLWSHSKVYLNSVDILDNSANESGGFYARTFGQGTSSNTHQWSKVKVQGNTAINSHGAGKFSKDNGSNTFILKNCLITDNTSNTYPGITFSNYDANNISIVNTTIYNNNGGSASAESNNNIGIWDNTKVRLLNSIVGRSGGAAGYTIYGFNCGAQYVMADASSVIEGGANSVYDNPCGSNDTKLSISNALTSGVYFVDPGNRDYSLSPMSSLLGTGLTANNLNFSSENIAGISITAPTTDLYGNARPNPVGSNPDIGAIENPLDTPQVGIATVVTNNGFCETTSGAITANLLNYTGTATYSWSSSTYPTWTWNATQSATGLSSGDYKVVAIDATSGSKIDSTEVTITTLPSIYITNTSTDVTCFGDDDGELTFEIYGGNPLGGSQYTYSVDYLESMAQATGVVLGSSYFDNDNNSSNRTNKYNADNWNGNPVYQGKYYVSVSDQDGCTFTDTVEVGYDHELPQVNITTLASDGTVGLTSMCEGTGNTINLTANVTGGGGTNTFSWSNASTAQTVGVAQTDDYYVEVTDQYTCVGKDTIDIYFQSAPQLMVENGAPAPFTGNSLTGVYANDASYLGEYENHHYYIITNQQTWNTARAAAEAIGGYLAIPNSFGENEFIENSLDNSMRDNIFLGAYWNGTQWIDVKGKELDFTYWQGSTTQTTAPNSNTTDYKYLAKEYWNSRWTNEWKNNSRFWIVEFEPSDAPVVFNQAFCDSIELKATPFVSAGGNGFTEIYWTDAQNDTINELEYKTFYADQDITLHGVFTRSDGETCDLSSITYSFDVNNSPNLELVALDSTYDYSGDTLEFYAYSDSVNAIVQWTHDTSLDTLRVAGVGSWTVTASLNGCSVSREVFVEQPIYVAKTGSDITGNGTLSSPYKTIQFAIDTANSGQKIFVLPGTYNENLVINKQVRLYSDVVRLNNLSAKNTTIVNAGYNGRIIEFSSNTRLDRDSTIIDGFTLKNGDTGGDSGSGLYANWTQGSGITIRNSILKNNRKSCCNDGIAISFHGVGLYLENVDIFDNGSPSNWDERMVIDLRHCISNWTNVRFRGNESNSYVIYLDNTDLNLVNCDFVGNTIQDNNSGLITLDWGSNLTMNHVTMTNNSGQGYGIGFRNNGDQNLIVYNSIISGFAEASIKTSGSQNKVYLYNSAIDNVPSSVSGNGQVFSSNIVEAPNLGVVISGSLASTSPALGLGGMDTTIAGHAFTVPRLDLAGNSRPIPIGTNPDAGAYEDSLAIGDFGLSVQNCGFLISSTVLNSSNYSVTVTGVGGFNQTGEQVQVSLKGTYLVTAVDSISGDVITQSVVLTNPLSIGYLWSRDACASNNGIGEIVFGDFSGGVDISPTEQWFDYYINVSDTSGSYSNDWQVHQGAGSTWNANVQAGQYIVALTDGSGCSVYDTVEIEDIQGSKYYISTTGSDLNSGVYADPLATIQEALNRACDGDTIVLFDGEYFENVQILNQNLPYVTIASEYIDNGVKSHIANTIVNGMDEDPVFDISNHNSTSDTIMFVGFTITNGKSSNWYGGGGISSNYSNVALKHMVVSGNRSGHAGGGIGIDGGYLNLWHTEISNNIASNDGGGIRTHYAEQLDGHGSTIIKNNKTDGNGGGISYGHGHWGSNEDFYVKGFLIENNSANNEGGGLYINNWGNNNGELLIENIKVLNNRSIYNNSGGMYISHNGEDAVMKNVIIANNRSNNTGGLTINDVDLDIVHSTIYANPVLDGTSSNDQIQLQNNANVLFLNSAVGGQVQVGTDVPHTFYLQDYDTTCDLTIANSIVQGGINSIDNPYSSTVSGTPIGQPLYLANPSQGDYMLSPVSQGLGAAASFYTGITMPYIDIEGMTRPNPVGSNPDVGAVESPLDSAEFGAAYEIRNNIACDPTYGRLKVTPLNGSGSYKYELDDLTGTATFADQQNVSSYTYSSLYSGDYLVTITDLFDSSVFTDTITVSGKDSLNIILDYNDEFCAGANDGAISIQVTGGDGYYDYTWSTLTNSNWPKSKNLNNLYPDEYFVTVKDGDNCFIEDSVTISTLHQLPAVAITGNIDKGGLITQTTNSIVRACAGDLVSLDAGAGFFSYNWSTEDQLNSWTTQTLSASYEESFYVTVVDSFGCSNVDSVEVFYVQRPAIFASNVNTNIGGTYQQVTSYVEGSNQYTGFGNEPKPYGANDRFAKMQFIIPANELIAEGLTDQTTINSLGFEVDLASGSPVQNFKIKLKNTTANQLSSTFETGLTEVYDFNILTAGDGWNTHEFDQGFVWDGTKNLLVQVEYSNVAFNNASNTYLIGHSTSYTSSSAATNYSSSVANQSSADNTYSWRPNMKLGIDKVQATDTLRVCDFTMLNTTDDYDTYSWLINGTSVGTQLRYSLATPQEVVLQTVDAASSCTMYSDTVQVLLDTTPTVFVTSNSLIGCVGDSVIAQVDTVKNNIQYLWSNGVNDTTAAFVESGTYYVYAVSPSGCQGVDTVNVDINIPPDLVIELNGRVLTATDGSLITNTSSCDTTLLLPYSSTVDTLSELNASEWTSYSSQFLEWEFNQGWDSLVDYTGPQYDADSNFHGGFYQFDPASITDQGKTGYLQLGCVNLVGMSDPAIEFAYHMVDVYADSSNTSDQMGTLAFEVKESSDDSWTTLWQRSGTDQSYGWANKVINLSGFVNQTIQMRWKATAGVGGPRTEMAIDNISITDSLATLSNISGRLTPETVCEGDSLYARTIGDSSSTFTYLWTNGETDGTIALTQTGWYGVSVIDGQGCEIVSDSVFIEVNPAPNNMLVLSDTTQYCFGQFDSLTISAVPGYTSYDWNINAFDSGAQNQSAGTSTYSIDSISTGTTGYYVTITDSIGCRANSDVVNLIQRDNPALQFVSNALLCNDDSTGSIDLTVVGNGGHQFDWSTGDSTQGISNLSAGWYTVAVTDSFSCSTVDSVEVVEPTPVVLTQVSTSDVLCFGGSDGYANYTFSGGVGGYTYAWTDSSGTWSSDSLSLANAPIGTYYLNAQDSNGCFLVDTVSIDQPSELILTLDSTVNLSCYQSADGQAFASVVGGFGSYTYRLDGNVVSTLSDTALNAGTHTYTVTDDNGCTDSVSFVLTEPQLLTASTVVSQYLGGIQISCNGANDGSIDVTVNGGTLPYSYSWTDGDTTEDRSLLVAGTYSMTVQDAQGCEVSVNEVLLEPTQVQMTSVVTDLDCYGATDAEVNYTVSGGTAPYATSWSGSAGTGVDSVYVTFQVDMQGASINTGGIQVVSNSGLNLPMNIVPVLEDSIYRVTTQVSAGSTIQYRFFNGSTAETVPTSCGVNVSGTFYREVQVLSDTTIATRAFSSCTVSAPGLSGAMITGARTLTGLGAGIYTMSMADVNGCTVVLTDTIVSPDSLYISSVSIVDASCPQTPDGFIDISAAGGTAPYTFSWSSGDTTEDITAAYGYYDLVVTDDKGCTDSSTYLIDAPFPYNDEEICVVTVDSTGVNMLVWEKTPGEKTASYEIFRENASTQFVSVGTNQYNDMSTWADQNSNPAVQPYRYKIAVVDSCGNYSDTSDYHATIHLQASQGVAANEVNLQWTAYEGKQVQTYYIYRWLSPINRILIDSVSSSVQTYTDIYPVNTTITALLYEVGAKFTNGGCSPSAGKQSSYVTSMSNQLDWGQDGGLPIGTEEWVDVVLESDLLIYPNPTRSYVNLELSGAWADQKDIRIKFTDMTGRIMAQKVVQGDGKHQFDFRELPAGIYFVQIITAEGRTIVHRFEKVN